MGFDPVNTPLQQLQDKIESGALLLLIFPLLYWATHQLRSRLSEQSDTEMTDGQVVPHTESEVEKREEGSEAKSNVLQTGEMEEQKEEDERREAREELLQARNTIEAQCRELHAFRRTQGDLKQELLQARNAIEAQCRELHAFRRTQGDSQGDWECDTPPVSFQESGLAGSSTQHHQNQKQQRPLVGAIPLPTEIL